MTTDLDIFTEARTDCKAPDGYYVAGHTPDGSPVEACVVCGAVKAWHTEAALGDPDMDAAEAALLRDEETS